MEDKFERTGMTAVKSSRVDAPIIEEYPITLECKVIKIQNDELGFRVIGEIVNVIHFFTFHFAVRLHWGARTLRSAPTSPTLT